MKTIIPLLLIFILFGLLIYYDNTQKKDTDKYKYIVTYDDGYKKTYSRTNVVKDSCIITIKGKICGTFYLEKNHRYKRIKQ